MRAKLCALSMLSVWLLLPGGCADVPGDSSEEVTGVEPASPGVAEQSLQVDRRPFPGPSCGGFAGTPCPGAGSCVDDPRDDCDPRNGGADCIGVCICRPNRTCPRGTVFDARPEVCGCRKVEPVCPQNPCTFTTCAVGSQCVLDDACQARCVPTNPAPCPPCPPGRLCPQVCRVPTL